MIRKILLGAVAAAGLAWTCMAADVIVRVAPPRVIVEKRGHAPGRGYEWISGYHRWDGERYNWSPGRWDLRPNEHARWEPHRWVRRDGGWVMVEGHWR